MDLKTAKEKYEIFKCLKGKYCPAMDDIIKEVVITFADEFTREHHLTWFLAGNNGTFPILEDKDSFAIYAYFEAGLFRSIKNIVLEDKVESLIEEAKRL